MTYTPTTEQVREGFAQDPVAEYYDPLTNHAKYGRKAFDRWLETHDSEVKAQALEEAANEWQTGAWTRNQPTGDRPQLLIGMAQNATDFLRTRAQQLKEQQ